MSQGGTGNEALASAALQAALATALVGHINERVVQPLEGRLQAQDARLDELCNDVRTFLGGGAPQPPAPSSGRTGSRQKKGSDVPQPDKMAENLMQNVVRRVLKSGCRIEHLNQAQLGLPEDELKDRIENDPPLPWRPDFLKSVNDRDNEFWVKKILDEVMKDTEGLAQVASKKIAQEFWTRECMHKRILGPMWSNVRKEVKKLVDAEAEARGKINRSKGNRGGRRKRLYKARLKLATGSGKYEKFEFKVDGVMRDIPVELMVEEAMSDVAAEEYESDSIPPEVSRDEYRKNRPRFEYEGVPPFFRRREPWNSIFQSMDTITNSKAKGFGIQARYYAGEITRGQRSMDPEMASKIPTAELYRCHISKEWYDRLSEAQRGVLKASPPGWEVDEERVLRGT